MRHRWPAGDRPASQDQVKSGATHPMNSILKMAGLGIALLTAACNKDAATNNADAAANKLAPAQGKDWTKARKIVVSGKSVSVRVELGGCRLIQKQKSQYNIITKYQKIYIA